MSDSMELLRRSMAHRPGTPQPLPVPPPEPDDELSCSSFGYLRGQREQAPVVEFRRMREGDSVSFPYSWLGPTRYHPSCGIMLLFVGSEMFLVTLQGRNLNALLEDKVSLYERGLLRHRVTWVQETTRNESERLPREECVVERIGISTLTPEEAAKALALEREPSPVSLASSRSAAATAGKHGTEDGHRKDRA